MEGAGADGDDAVFVAFALADLEGLAVAVEVVDLQFCEFAAPKCILSVTLNNKHLTRCPPLTNPSRYYQIIFIKTCYMHNI